MKIDEESRKLVNESKKIIDELSRIIVEMWNEDESINFEELENMEESDASEEARELGLVHRGFGRYSSKKHGPIGYQTQGGKLVPFVDSGTSPKSNTQDTSGETEKEKEEMRRKLASMKKRQTGLTDVEKAGDEPYAYTFRWNGKAGKIIFTKIEIAFMKEKGLPPSKIILDRIEKKIEKKNELRKSKEEKITQRRKKSILLTKLLKKHHQHGGKLKDREKEK